MEAEDRSTGHPTRARGLPLMALGIAAPILAAASFGLAYLWAAPPDEEQVRVERISEICHLDSEQIATPAAAEGLQYGNPYDAYRSLDPDRPGFVLYPEPGSDAHKAGLLYCMNPKHAQISDPVALVAAMNAELDRMLAALEEQDPSMADLREQAGAEGYLSAGTAEEAVEMVLQSWAAGTLHYAPLLEGADSHLEGEPVPPGDPTITCSSARDHQHVCTATFPDGTTVTMNASGGGSAGYFVESVGVVPPEASEDDGQGEPDPNTGLTADTIADGAAGLCQWLDQGPHTEPPEFFPAERELAGWSIDEFLLIVGAMHHTCPQHEAVIRDYERNPR